MSEHTNGSWLREVRETAKAAGDDEAVRLASVALNDAWPEAPTFRDMTLALAALADRFPDDPYLNGAAECIGQYTMNEIHDMPARRLW